MLSEEKRGCWLVVDDDDRLRERLVQALLDRGLPARGAAGYDAALEVAREQPITHAVVDLRMPGRSGMELLRELMTRKPAPQVVMLTGYGSIATAVEAVRLGALDYVQKPTDVDRILAAFHVADGAAGPSGTYEPPSLARSEWEHINRVLEDCDGNISQAARKLGLHRRTLQRKLQKYPPRK